MRIKGLVDCDFVNYCVPALVIASPYCDFKCDKENGCRLCQNSHLAQSNPIYMSAQQIIENYYMTNPLTSAIVFQGLEPFDSFKETKEFIDVLRTDYKINDDVVIYTGYTEEEAKELVNELIGYKNIIVKYGRFVPNQSPHYDAVLGVSLASDNQYAVRY